MTRLTDKEREAVEWMRKHATPHIRSEVYGSILASCVTRLDAPVGGLETVAWGTIDCWRLLSEVQKKIYVEKGWTADIEFSKQFTVPLVLRSAAEAKIAGLVDVLRGALESINLFRENVKDGTVARGVFEGYFTGVDVKIRSLIETDGGEDANRN